MADSVREFYDELAESYDLIFADWQGSMRRRPRRSIASFRHSSDRDRTPFWTAPAVSAPRRSVSPSSATRCTPPISAPTRWRSCRTRLATRQRVAHVRADMRARASQVDGVRRRPACDNALPHLLEDDDLRLAVDNMFAKLRPGGLFLASIRDYDRSCRNDSR